ncbi:chemoreceptor glutamine deamidase CheD [Burkholderiaceae bacterium DAT-1]|nr:chemoreceptor glutamine deamidase CheD [Burkholderiaceae bacterium DAT-1]
MSQGFEEVLSPHRYYDKYFEIEAVKLLPGEYFATQRDMLLVTVLGSCVSACIRDRKHGIGGMNHFMLPDSSQDNMDPIGLPSRFGSYAMEMLINHLIKLGAERRNLEAKIFGGGQVLRGFTVSNIGERNADFVHQYLDAERIPILAEDLNDIYPRKVYYFPKTGRVLIKKLKSVHNDTIVQREREYGTRLSHANFSGDAELF